MISRMFLLKRFNAHSGIFSIREIEITTPDFFDSLVKYYKRYSKNDRRKISKIRNTLVMVEEQESKLNSEFIFIKI